MKLIKTSSSTRVLEVPQYIINKIKELPRDGDFVIK